MNGNVAEQIFQAMTYTARIIQALIELFKNRARKKIEKLNEEIQDLKDDAKKTGENHKDEIEEKKGQIEKLQGELKKLENIDLNDPVYQQMMVNNMNAVLNKGNEQFVQNGALTQEGMNEAANRTINDIAKHTGIGIKKLEERVNEVVPQMYSEDNLKNLAEAIKDNDNDNDKVPKDMPKLVKFVFDKLDGKTEDDIKKDRRIEVDIKYLACRIASKRPISIENNMFYYDKKAKSFASNSIGANPAPTHQQEV